VIKAIGWGGNLLVLGLERANCDKLLEGKPILVAPEQLDGLRQFVLLVAGEDGDAIKRELAQVLPAAAVDAPAPARGEVVKVGPEGTTVEPAPDPNLLAARAARDEALRRVRELELALTYLLRAAWNVMETSEDFVSEEQGLARMNALADLVGYPRPGGPPPRPQPSRKEVLAGAEKIGDFIEAAVPNGWTFTLFLYPSRPGGQIAHMARDPELSRAIVRRYLEETGTPAPKARG
jgi:hypothetical protein